MVFDSRFPRPCCRLVRGRWPVGSVLLLALGIACLACEVSEVPTAVPPPPPPPPYWRDAEQNLPQAASPLVSARAPIWTDPAYPTAQPQPSTPTEPASVPEGPYIATVILGGTLVGAASAGVIGGVFSIVEAATSKDSGSTLGLGIALVDIAPHVLATGIVMLAMNASAHARAKSKAGIG